jgi:hypothetical protein
MTIFENKLKTKRKQGYSNFPFEAIERVIEVGKII